MSASVTATTQPAPYVPPAGSNPVQSAAVLDQKANDLTQLAVQADRAAKGEGTGATLDILA